MTKITFGWGKGWNGKPGQNTYLHGRQSGVCEIYVDGVWAGDLERQKEEVDNIYNVFYEPPKTRTFWTIGEYGWQDEPNHYTHFLGDLPLLNDYEDIGDLRTAKKFIIERIQTALKNRGS